MAPRFSTPRINVIESDSGYSIEVLGRDGMRYTEDGRTMFLDSEVLATPASIAMHPASVKRWDAPHDAVVVDATERERIIDNIRQAFESQGYRLVVD
jgi:hypothetical protein